MDTITSKPFSQENKEINKTFTNTPDRNVLTAYNN